MNTVSLPKRKVKDFLANQLMNYILQIDETSLYEILRYDGIGGYENLTDKQIFLDLVDSIPEFKLLRLVDSNEEELKISVIKEHEESEDAILVDIKRIIQTKF
jgi:hypothetical protein